mmetsp:Transcript_38950/g.50355  ORF Transcript_38950/g.50355 Transcript_38950/m.50355 type:complete len:450 (+) Transcript_38950:113-1462(+)
MEGKLDSMSQKRGKILGDLVPVWLGAEVILAALSNLAISFNVVNISLVLQILAEVYNESAFEEDSTSSALIAGMVIGQLVLGFLGDWLGRRRALLVTILLAIVGAIGSAFIAFKPDIFIYIICFRFILGIGAGGVYPLCATYAKESSPTKEIEGTVVSFVFSMQGLGYLLAPVVTLLVIETVDSKDLQWRFILGFGALLLGSVLWLMVWLPDRKPPRALTRTQGQGDSVGASLCHLLSTLSRPDYIRMVVGTGGCWFLFDVTFYGNTLFQTEVLKDAFGDSEAVGELAVESIVVYAIALPGYYVAVALMKRLGPKVIQIQGFAMMAFLYIFIGAAWSTLDNNAAVLLVLYSLTFFFSNFGPNSTTFILPSLTFPAEVRSSFNGIAAAMGKLGALVGSLCFEPLSEVIGSSNVLIVCGIIAICGIILTTLFVKPNNDADSEIEDMSRDLL